MEQKDLQPGRPNNPKMRGGSSVAPVGKSDNPKTETAHNDFAFGKTNYMALAIGMAVVVLGFILMAGSGSTETAYDPEIFSARRIKVAPVVCLVGFVSMIFAILYKDKK